MDRQARVLVEMTGLFREIFVDDRIVLTPQTTAADISGWDSMKHIEIVMAVEERYGLRLGSREVDGLRSIADLIAIVVRKTS